MNEVTMSMHAPAPAAPQTPNCSRCAVRDLCLPSGAEPGDAVRIDGLIGYRRRVARGETLFRRGQSFSMVYAVRFGHLKSFRPDHRGAPHITAFSMAGDLMGLDAIGGGRHSCSAVALEDCEVCEIPYSRLQDALRESPSLMQRFHVALSHEIVREQESVLHADMGAAERLASLLLNLSSRYAERGYSERRFHLRMSRADIGDYLGLTIESISRLLTRFREEAGFRSTSAKSNCSTATVSKRC
ncbi:cyclic nucleotide-binding domain-containing protein [Massilia brevitalea]|uniref:cyclic nucleotide-binding domain-containing protein n=1 Tax=Massilia brevitalea TaxID=442526 RepID=UPI002804CF14|nr:cyclic nucleotide-binding domain-containing protein [Massilia brevitalea]